MDGREGSLFPSSCFNEEVFVCVFSAHILGRRNTDLLSKLENTWSHSTQHILLHRKELSLWLWHTPTANPQQGDCPSLCSLVLEFVMSYRSKSLFLNLTYISITGDLLASICFFVFYSSAWSEIRHDTWDASYWHSLGSPKWASEEITLAGKLCGLVLVSVLALVASECNFSFPRLSSCNACSLFDLNIFFNILCIYL